MISISGMLWPPGASPELDRLECIGTPVGTDLRVAITTWTGDGVALACAGSGTDAEPAGQTQPLVDRSSGSAIVFDGRLDNRDELAAQLSDDPLLRGQASDAAISLAAYLRWGDGFLARVLGDFALAIWDPRRREVLLARDPIGMRPLYYSTAAGRLAFASTLEQMLGASDLSRELDEAALVWHLYGPDTSAGGDNQPLAGRTCYRHVRAVPRGHAVRAAAAGVRVFSHFELPRDPPEPSARPLDEMAEELRALLTEAVRCRLRGPGPAGLMLSGGLDSGAIACLAGSLPGAAGLADLHAYSNVFDRFASCDERAYAVACSSALTAPPTLLAADERWSLSSFAPATALVEPFFSPYDDAIAPLLARARADGVSVMLSGNGGDHVLTGSPSYLADWLLAGRWGALHRELAARPATRRWAFARGLLRDAVLPLAPVALQRRVWRRQASPARRWLPARLRERYHPSLPSDLGSGRRAWWHALRSPLDLARQVATGGSTYRLPRRLGIDIAQPFFDLRIVRFVLSLPPDALYRAGTPKALLRDALRDVFPPLVRDRTDKADMSPLLYEGLRRRRPFLAALLHDSELERRGLVRPQAWRASIAAYLDGARPPYWENWRSLTLEMWLRARAGRLPPL